MTTKKLCINALGIALFVALSLCLQIPVFENYYLCLGYIVMAVYCYHFGAGSGMLVGSLGVVLYCVLTNGLRGMIGWSLGNILIGAILGYIFNNLKDIRAVVLKNAVFLFSIIFSVGYGILGLKSLVECILFSQPFIIRAGKNIYAFVADVVVLVVGVLVAQALQPIMKRLEV